MRSILPITVLDALRSETHQREVQVRVPTFEHTSLQHPADWMSRSPMKETEAPASEYLGCKSLKLEDV